MSYYFSTFRIPKRMHAQIDNFICMPPLHSSNHAPGGLLQGKNNTVVPQGGHSTVLPGHMATHVGKFNFFQRFCKKRKEKRKTQQLCPKKCPAVKQLTSSLVFISKDEGRSDFSPNRYWLTLTMIGQLF